MVPLRRPRTTQNLSYQTPKHSLPLLSLESKGRKTPLFKAFSSVSGPKNLLEALNRGVLGPGSRSDLPSPRPPLPPRRPRRWHPQGTRVVLGFRVKGLGFRVWGLGFGVWGLGFGVWGLGCLPPKRVWGVGLWVAHGLGAQKVSG